MIEVHVKCRHCGRSLMDEENRIDNRPSVKVIVQMGKKKGPLNMSSFYGSYTLKSKVKLPEGRMIRVFCPYCKTEIKGARVCESCKAHMIPLALQEGGLVQICSRKGCKKHLFEFEDPEAEIRAFYAAYSTFFK